MNLEETWRKLSITSPKLNAREVQGAIANKKEGVLKKLQNQFFLKMIFIVLFSLLYLTLVLLLNDLIVRLLIGILFVTHLIALAYAYGQWQRIKQPVDYESPALEVLKETLRRLRTALKLEERFGLFIYPIAASAGFFIPLTLKFSWEELLDKTFIWIVLFITILVLTPLSHYFAKRMNKLAFGKYITKLESSLEEFDRE